MAKDYIDELCESVNQETLRQDQFTEENPPRITGHNRKDKTISVQFDFNYGEIPGLKLICSYIHWIDLQFADYDYAESAPELIIGDFKAKIPTVPTIGYVAIQDNLADNTSSRKKELIHAYALRDPEGFQQAVMWCAQVANQENPRYGPATKPRKNIYGLSKGQRWDIANTTIRLYFYLLDMRHELSLPSHIQRCLQYYAEPGNSKFDLERSSALIIQEEVAYMVSEHFERKLNLRRPFGDRFWKTFVDEGPISLRRARKLFKRRKENKPNPTNDPFLKDFFQRFIR